MARKSSSGLGGCLVQIVLGFLAAIAAALAVLFFLSSAPLDAEVEGPSLADEAAARAQTPDDAVEAPAARAPTPRDVTVRVPPLVDAGIDPRSDDQMADDAAAAGMTSRTPSPAPE
ncbi:MAG: hypothetical protein Q7J28_14820 [Caulobacter sp.]|nr:hypothetical protein [Caulobacter sp.]